MDLNFKELLIQAQEGNQQVQERILLLYQPLLLKESTVNGTFDEDIYQELCITLLSCIQRFQI